MSVAPAHFYQYHNTNLYDRFAGALVHRRSRCHIWCQGTLLVQENICDYGIDISIYIPYLLNDAIFHLHPNFSCGFANLCQGMHSQ